MSTGPSNLVRKIPAPRASRGKAWEDLWDLSMEVQAPHAGFTGFRVPVPFKEMKGGRQGAIFRAVRNEKAWVDFVGITVDGVSVNIEQKMTDNDRLLLSKVEQHQRNTLDAACRCSAIAYVAVWFRQHDKAFMVPWPLWKQKKSPGSWQVGELEEAAWRGLCINLEWVASGVDLSSTFDTDHYFRMTAAIEQEIEDGRL